MTKTVLEATLSLIKMSVPVVPGMLLTDTFKAAGRSAMILDAVSPSPQAAERTTYRVPDTGQRRAALRRGR